MRALILSVVTAIAVGATGLAHGQSADTLSLSSSQIYDACITNNQGPPLECACMAGFYGGRLQADEYRLISVLNRYVGPGGAVRDMPAVQRAIRDEATTMGLSDQRFGQIMQRFSVMETDGAYGDRVCMVMRGK
jgi:hypothetical protein